MVLVSVEGVYRNGAVELSEHPEGVSDARVVVTFMTPEQPPRGRGRSAAAERAFARMDAGISFGGERFVRTDVYEERLRDLDGRRNSG